MYIYLHIALFTSRKTQNMYVYRVFSRRIVNKSKYDECRLGRNWFLFCHEHEVFNLESKRGPENLSQFTIKS